MLVKVGDSAVGCSGATSPEEPSHCMGTIAPVCAVLQESALFRGQKVILFKDNVGAEHVLGKGSSNVDDINRYCAAFWLLVAWHTVSVKVFRVPSKENPADALSRGEVPFSHDREDVMSFFTEPSELVQSGSSLRELVPRELW